MVSPSNFAYAICNHENETTTAPVVPPKSLLYCFLYRFLLVWYSIRPDAAF